MKTLKTEALIIGSGFGAAAPGLRLSRAGVRVLMIEKGKDIVPHKDFKQTQDPKYLQQYLQGISSDSIGFTYAEALGGGSGFYEMVSLRAPSKVFEQVNENGKRFWPKEISRHVLDPFYDLAERELGVEQITPDAVSKSGVVFSLMMKNLGYSCDRARFAVKGCVGSGYCISGCVFGAKQSLHYNYLPKAVQAGMTIFTDTEALSIRPLSSGDNMAGQNREIAALPYRYEVHCERKSGERIAIRAKIVILGGGTVGAAKLLLNSRRQLQRLSDQVGKNIAFNGCIKAAGILPETFIKGDMFTGMSHAGMISYHFLEDLGVTISALKPLPLYFVISARMGIAGKQPPDAYWGQPHVELMKLYRRRIIVLYALGLTPPAAELRQIKGNELQPVLEINDELRSYRRKTKALLNSIFTRNGCKVIQAELADHQGQVYNGIHFSSAHMVGSCRMAGSKSTGVVDAYGEVFDYPGLFVTDGAAIPTSLAVNSSLTILANAERIASSLVKRFGRG